MLFSSSFCSQSQVTLHSKTSKSSKRSLLWTAVKCVAAGALAVFASLVVIDILHAYSLLASSVIGVLGAMTVASK